MKTRIYSNLLIVAIVVSFFACKQKSEGTDAKVSEAKQVEKTDASQEYVVDTASSVVTWIGSKPTGKHDGTIPVSKGVIAVKDDAIVGGSMDLSIAGITSTDLADSPEMHDKLIGHLLSPDFFDAKNHPTANFTITSAKPYSESNPVSVDVKEEFDTEYKPVAADEYMVGSPTHEVTGNLMMRGKTLSITFPAKVTMQGGKIMASAKFNIDRTMWGLMYGDEASVVDKAKDKFIYNTVNVELNLKAAAPSM